MNNAVMFGKASDEWSTPQDFFDQLNTEFAFQIDAAATAQNTKCGLWWEDALTATDWAIGPNTRVWLNPPYSQGKAFVARAKQEAKKGCLVVCLIPSRTDTRMWHEHIWDNQQHQPRAGVEVRFVKGRLRFGGSANSAPFPSVVVIFRPPA